MQINIKTNKFVLDSKSKDYVTEKINMLEKYLGDTQVLNCDVEVGLTTGGQNTGKIFYAEVNLEVPGELIRVKKVEKDILKAIDKTKDHLARSIKRYKEKKVDKKRQNGKNEL